jgi:hypothetical protein
MRSIAKFLLVAAVFVAGTLTADAQGRRGGTAGGGGQPPGGGRQGGGMMGGMMGGAGPVQLVTNKSVAEELKFTDEQKETLKKWAEETQKKQMEKMRELYTGGERPDPTKTREMMQSAQKEQMEEVSKVIKDDQVKRLKQIMLQIANVQAFSQKEVQDGLKLTDEQKDTIKEIGASMREEMMESFRGAGGGNAGERPSPEEMQKLIAERQKKTAELNKKYMEKVKNQLKDEQKTAWAEMIGKEFDYKPEMPQMRRRDN